MAYDTFRMQRISEGQVVETPSVPEKRLLAAILERAMNDLKINEGCIERTNALNWFLDDPKVSWKNRVKITFRDVAEVLELNSSAIEKINKLIDHADQKEKENCSRHQRRRS